MGSGRLDTDRRRGGSDAYARRSARGVAAEELEDARGSDNHGGSDARPRPELTSPGHFFYADPVSRRAAFIFAGLLATLGVPREAAATYSIIAVDSARGQVGAAGASCVPYEVIRIHGNVPGRGAFVAQANFDNLAFEHAMELLSAGESAPDILGAITDASVFPQAPKMQYGVVDVGGRLASWTGPEALAVADNVEGSLGETTRFAVLGNLLTSARVLSQGQAGFEASGCDLPAQLMDALEAAGADGEGDGRCTPEGRPANSAFLEVSDADGTLVRISVPDVSPDDPIATLRDQFEEWRIEHPCPEPPSTGGESSDGPAEDTSTDGCAAGGAAPSPFAWLIVLSGCLLAHRLATRAERAYPVRVARKY